MILKEIISLKNQQNIYVIEDEEDLRDFDFCGVVCGCDGRWY